MPARHREPARSGEAGGVGDYKFGSNFESIQSGRSHLAAAD
jgi:hypothetical protein